MTTLDLETYARIVARVACRRGARPEQILSEFGIDAEAFCAAEPVLREELALAWAKRRGLLAMKVVAALGDELQRLGALGGEGAAPDASILPPNLVPLLVAAPEREVRGSETPSYLQAQPTTDRGGVLASAVVAPAIPVEPATRAQLAGTANVDLSAVVAAVKQGALPFSPGHPEAPAPDAREPRPPTERRVPPVGSGTIEADLSAVIASAYAGPAFVRPAAPAPAPSPGTDEPDLTQLPLETYASVSAALARGEPREVALARHGLTAESFGRLAQAWGQRFQREPQLLARFKELARSGASAGRNDEGR